MSDCSDEDIFQYQSLKKRKIGEDDAPYEVPSSSGSSQKIKKKKKKKSSGKRKSLLMESVEEVSKAESVKGSECMEFCPMCQMPLSIAIGSPDLHVMKCVGDFEKSSFEGECPFGLKCDITIQQHYQRYSHHLLSQLRAGLKAEIPQSVSRESEPEPEMIDSCEDPVPVVVESPICSSPVNMGQTYAEVKEEAKARNKFEDINSEMSDSPSGLNDVPKEDMQITLISSESVQHPSSSHSNNLTSSDTELSVDLSPRKKMARKTFPFSPRQFHPEKVVCLLDPSSDGNSSEVPMSKMHDLLSEKRKIPDTVGNADERSQELKKGLSDSSTAVNARMSCAYSSLLDPNSTVSFCQKLSEHQTSTPKSVKPRNVARKSIKGKKYLSIEDVQNSQKAASKEYYSKDQSCQDVSERKHRKQLNFMETGNVDSKDNTGKVMNDSDELADEVIEQRGGSDANIGRCTAEYLQQRTPSPSLFEFGHEKFGDEDFGDDCDAIELLDNLSQRSEICDYETDTREPSSQGSSQCNKITVQSQIDRYFISPRKSSSQETSASNQNVVKPDSKSSATSGGNAKPKATWKDIFRFSQGTKFSPPDMFSQSQSTNSTTSSQSLPANSVSSSDNPGQSGESSSRAGNSMWSKSEKRQCPFYKKMPGTSFAVDAFSYGDIPDITAYFLTHFHSDHYGGLTKKFTNPIYCSVITANLVKAKLYVPSEFVHPFAVEEEHVIEGVKVTFLDANHCPGSVLILFKLPNGLTYLHTGDFRAHQRMELYPQLQNIRVHKLYLDTTYLDPKYDFPKQEDVIRFAVSTALRAVQENPKTLILCGTYTIGKEKIFKAISDALECQICVESDKKRILTCYNDDQLTQKLVTDKRATRLHVVGMAKLNLKRLALYLEEYHNLFDNIVAFKPTGWTHSSKVNSLADIKPSKWGRIQIYGIPYSEHSSYSEMKRFVQFIRASGPTHIIPTVNVGRPDQRAFMESHFKLWMTQGNTSVQTNGSQMRLHGTSPRRNMPSSQQSKTLQTFFTKK